MKAIVSLSGGMDSATVLAEALTKTSQVQAVGFAYGSKHGKWENEAAKKIANYYSIEFTLVDLTAVMNGFKSALLLSGDAIPEGHYEAESMKQTVVPGRNSIFASILLGIAQSNDADQIWLGIHAGDRAIYPDCRSEWFYAMWSVAMHASEGKVSLHAPFLNTDKVGILKRGFDLGVPYQLTRTCYTSDEIACGRCGSCNERRDAFQRLGVTDPIAYKTGV